MLLAAHKEGRFPIEKLIKTYDWRKYETAIKDSQSGAAIKAILLWDE